MTDASRAAALTLRPIASSDGEALSAFFDALVKHGDERFFAPHPFTADEAHRLAAYAGGDIYVVAEEGGTVLGYGLLRGWDEGFAVPSLGIAIHPDARGTRLGGLLMEYLHALARRRGAARVRLRVHRDNRRAAELYRALGYVFADQAAEYLVGFLELSRAPARS